MAKRISEGEELGGIPVQSWNEFCDTADRVKALPGPDARPKAGKSSLKGLVIQCQNTTGADLTAEFPIVRLTDPPITPTDYDNIVRQGIVLKGDTPDATNAFWGVMQGPCPDDSQRPIVFRGLTWATVNIVSAEDVTCGPTSGNVDKLQSGVGNAAIRWKPDGTGDHVCLVDVGGGDSLIKVVTQYAIVTDTAATAIWTGSGAVGDFKICPGLLGKCILLEPETDSETEELTGCLVMPTPEGEESLTDYECHLTNLIDEVPLTEGRLIKITSTAGRSIPRGPYEIGNAPTVWGEYVRPTDYLLELDGVAAEKILWTADGLAVTWAGEECE